jgi:hypothetical protein
LLDFQQFQQRGRQTAGARLEFGTQAQSVLDAIAINKVAV